MTVAQEPQHEQARAEANRVRFARTQLKREIRAGEVQMAEILLAEIPDWLERMPLEKLLRSMPWLRSKRLTDWLSAISSFEGLPCSPNQPVGRLTMRQRYLLAGMVEDWQSKRRAAA